MEVIAVLFVLGLIALIIIGFITVLVWFAKLFGGSSPQAKPLDLQQPKREGHCSGCGGVVRPEDVFCLFCGKPQRQRANSLQTELATAERVLHRLFDAQRIDEASFTHVKQALQAERARLSESQRTEEVATAPVAAEVTRPVVATASVLPKAEATRVQTPLEPPVAPPVASPVAQIEVAAPPPEPRRSFTEMLAEFMEESSIRWGELVGAVLIIGCSLALVVSLWSEIAERPFLKFSVFMAITAGLFGLGFYSAHRWKLPTTSRGVLLTATLLVPLNFLGVASFNRTAGNAGIIFAESVAWLLMAALVWQGARVFALDQQRWLTLGTMGGALALWLGKHFTQAGLNWRSWLALGALPVALFVISTGAAVRAARQSDELGERATYGLFTLLGANLFAAALPLGLLLVRAGLSAQAWRECAPLLALAGVPLLATGWLLWRKLRTAELAGERTIAASLGLCGAAILVGSAWLALPLVEAMLVVALLNAVVFGWAAWRYAARVARFFALAQAIYVLLLVEHLALGRLTWGLAAWPPLYAAFFSTASAVLLAVVFTLLSGAAEWLRTRGVESGRGLQRDCETAALVIASISLFSATLDGFGDLGDPHRVAWLYGFYALAAFVLAWRRDEVLGSWLGLALLFVTCVQTCIFKLGWPQGWSHATIVMWLVFATAAALLVLLTVWGSEKARRLLAKPALQAAWLSAGWASLAMMFSGGLNVWYLWPLLMVALACVVYAWRAGSERAACAGGLIFNGVVSVSYAIWSKGCGSFLPTCELAQLALANLLTSSTYALIWGWAIRVASNGSSATTAAPELISPTNSATVPRLLRRQADVVRIVWLTLLALAAMRIIVEPWLTSEFAQVFGGVLGWAVFAAIALLFVSIRPLHLPSVNHLAIATLTLGTMIACTLQRFESQGWPAYHALLTTTAFGAWLMLWLLMLLQRGQHLSVQHSEGQAAPANLPRQTAAVATAWANGLIVATSVLALRGYTAPGGPWRGVVALALMAVLTFGLALARRNGAYCYAGGALACTALTMWIFGYSHGDGTLLDVLMLNVALLALIGLLSLTLELKWLRAGSDAPAKNSVVPFHQFAAGVLLALMCVRVGVGLLLDVAGEPQLQVNGRIGALALAAVVALCVGCLWDSWFAYRFVALYAAGLAVLGALLDRQNLGGDALAVWCAVALTAYGLLAALAWRKRETVAEMLTSWRVPQLDWRGEAGLWWLPTANALVAAGAVLAAGWASVMPLQLSWRVAAASVALFAPLALGWLARGAKRIGWQVLTLALVFLSVVSWSGAWLMSWRELPPVPLDWHRLVILLSWAVGSALVFYCAEAARWRDWSALLGTWEEAARNVIRGLSIIGLAALGLVLFNEWLEVTPAGVLSLDWWAKLLLLVLLTALVGANVGFALWPGRAPFDWQGQQRGRFIYFAEVCAVLLLAHVRMIAPWLFGGLFKAYWPMFVLALAFAGVGVGEQLRRRGRVVLAEPLARTGMFLPLLPSLGFWLVGSQVDYAGVLLAVGLFYGLLSVMRQSFGFGLLAALAGNGGLWHWLHRTDDFGFATHPQVWLIPAALSVMVAAHLNREQLSQEQMTTIRYTALMAVYVSSTADIFINGVADSPWLPLILAVLSVAGVLLGILLRVRAYLFLGTAFLLLAVITMVWHAALSLGWGWLWYVTGIAFGVLIIYLFAMFERKRAEMLGLVERLKSWQA
jgi:hypothetical protein